MYGKELKKDIISKSPIDNIDLETELESNNDTKHDDSGNRDLNSFISTNYIVKISLTIAILCSLSYFYVRTRND